MQQKIRLIILCLALISLCASCSYYRSYQPRIQQGNVITEKMIHKLRLGMSKSEVDSILEDPVYLDTFTSDQWTYIYTVIRAKRFVVYKRAIIYFQGGRVSHIETYLPVPPPRRFRY